MIKGLKQSVFSGRRLALKLLRKIKQRGYAPETKGREAFRCGASITSCPHFNWWGKRNAWLRGYRRERMKAQKRK